MASPLILSEGILYIGSVGSDGKPDGGGTLLLGDGSAHVGLFTRGAAHGDGIYFDRAGSVHTGCWQGNKRVGEFSALDPTGCLWDDVYDQSGKRTSRKRVALQELGTKAATCHACRVRFHPEHNFVCRGGEGGELKAAHECVVEG